MLRKLSCGCRLTTFVVQVPLFPQPRRFLAIRSAGVLLDDKPLNTPTNAVPSAADEDLQDLQREWNLRERFAQKVQQGIPQIQDDGVSGQRGSPVDTAPLNPFAGNAGASMFNFLFFSTLLLFLPLLLFAGHQSQLADVQWMPWRELPVATVACYLLLRTLYPRKDQLRIKTEYGDASRKNPYLAFDQFIVKRYPNLFDGYRTSQAEAIAAVSACLVSAKNLKFGGTMLRAVGRAKDTRASVDTLMNALREEFPNVF